MERMGSRRMVVGSACLAVLLAACAPSTPRFVPADETAALEPEGPVVQEADLAGELLVSSPESRAEDVLARNPEVILPLVGIREGTQSTLPPVEVDLPDTTAVTAAPIVEHGPRKEYQVQVAITPSAEEAQDFVERLTPLLEGEEPFIVFTSPYYRIRVGHKPTREEADVLLRQLNNLGYTGAMVIPVTIQPDREPR